MESYQHFHALTVIARMVPRRHYRNTLKNTQTLEDTLVSSVISLIMTAASYENIVHLNTQING